MEIYYSIVDETAYTQKEINEIIEKSDTLTSDNWEQEEQKIIDNLQLEYIGEYNENNR